MRLRSLFLFTASLSGVALAIGCSSNSGTGRTVDGNIRDSDSDASGGEATGESGSGSGLAQAFTEVDNGFESDDPRASGAGDGMRGAALPMMRNAANSASGANNSASMPVDAAGDGWLDSAAAVRAVEEADIIKVDGNRLYALSRYGGLAVVDIANPDRMKLLGRKRTDGMPFEMYVQDGRAFVMLNDFGRYLTEDGTRYGRWVETSELLAFDVSNPANITELSHFDVPGKIADSRLVGDVAYLVTYEDGHCWRCQDKPATIVTSFGIGGAITSRDQLAYASPDRSYSYWQRSVSATDQRLYIAGPEWSWAPGKSNARSVIQVVDITNPTGKLVKGADVPVDGRIESRWQMDEHAGVLRVVSQFGNRWGGTNAQINPKVQTFKVTSSTQITPLGSTELHLPKPEQLRSVRFDGARGYAITAERTDPLFTIDLSEPAAPKQAGELAMPGWIFHMEPRGDRLVGFGYDDTNQSSANLSVSLFDVSNITKPTMLKRVSFGAGWGQLAEDQDRIHKSVRVLDEAGMVLVPFASQGRWNSKSCEPPQSGIQLIDYTRDDLMLRGLAPQWGMPRRALVANGRLIAMSDRNVTSFDITSRDAPAKTHELDISNPAYRLAELPNHIASITSDQWTGEVMLSLIPKANADDAAVTGKLSLAPLAPPSELYCSGSSGWTSWYDARLFADGKTVYVTVPAYYSDGRASRGKLIAAAIDVSDPMKPFIAGKAEMLFSERDLSRGGWGWYGGFADGWAFYEGGMNGSLVGSGQAAVQYGSKLAYIETDHEPFQIGTKDGNPLWSSRAHRRLHIVDFASPALPKTYAIELPQSLGSSPLHVYKGTVLSSRWVRSTKNPDKVRFFVDRIDLNGPTPAILPSINTPGSLLLADEASSRFVTTDYRVERGVLPTTPNEQRVQDSVRVRYSPVPPEDCSTVLGFGARYDQEGAQCILVARDFKLADVADTKVTLRQTMTLPSQNIAGVQIADDRIYVTRFKQYDYSSYNPSEYAQPRVVEDGGFWAIGGIRAGELSIVSQMIGDADWPLAAHGTKVALHTEGGLAIYDTATPEPALVTQANLRGYGYSSHVLMSDSRAVASLGEWGLQTIAY